MEYWGPWSSYYKKSGGTISGNVDIAGTLTVAGITTLNNDTNVNGQVVITHDDPIGISPHLKLKSATAAGLVNATSYEDDVATFRGGVGFIGPNIVCLIPPANGVAAMPCDVFGGIPTWKVPDLVDSLHARRMMMLHSVMFGV